MNNLPTRAHLFTRHCQLSLRTEDSGKTSLCYFGGRLHTPDDAFLHPACVWPLLPTDADERGTGGNHSGESALNIILPDGTRSLMLQTTDLQQEPHRLILIMEDKDNPGLRLRLTITAWEKEDVLEWQYSLSNNTEGNLTLLRADSCTLPLKANSYHLTSFRGCWSGENELHEERIPRGHTLSLASTTGIKTAQEGIPGFILSLGAPAQEETGNCLLGALCWSGNYELRFKHSIYGHLFIGMGHAFAQSPYLLEKGQQLELPSCLLVFSDRGKGEASRRLHRFMRSRLLPRGKEIRRSLLNSWEGVHFDIRESTLHELMDHAAWLGAEMFVLDDGWFGHREDDTSSLGDWQTDLRRIPHGLSGLAGEAQKRGLAFGLWLEPEMISPDSELFRNHPDWALQWPGKPRREERHQLVLDLTNPDVENFVLQTVSRLLSTHPGISYIKWDCNRTISDPCSPFLPPQKQGNLFFDYICAYYRIMKNLRRAFPDVTFQCCSAGGGRLDPGAAAFHEEFWLSDNTDALERLRMQWAASHFFPANALGSHVTISPNLYTGRESTLKFRVDVATGCRIGLELDPRQLPPGERQELRERLALAQQLRPLVQQGELYRLLSPFTGPDSALLFRRGHQALLLAYTTERPFTDQRLLLPLRGLEATARYRVEELAPDATGRHCPLHETSVGGDYLMTRGIPIHWNRPLQSCVLWLTDITDS